MRAILLFIFLLLSIISMVFGQSVSISGEIVDKESKKGLQSITVLLKDRDNKVIAYKLSDAKGQFVLTTSKDITGAFIEINHLGYKQKKLESFDSKLPISIELEQNVILLEDIQVKSRPRLIQKGDTLSYNVNSFTKEEDRSIGDVLKRMPGIEVSESGQIKYQGKSISNFYIDGDDLLKNKYGIGSKTIPHNLVKDIEVYRNHEHIKVLKNQRYTDEVALNLVIKEEAKLSLSGQAKVGVGLPKLYDLETNTVLFNKKYKGLNVLQGNNVGNELKGNLIGFGRTPINNLLSLGTIGNPPVQQSQYLMNNSVGINANNLFNLKNNWQVTSNIQGVFEKQSKNFAGKTSYLTEEGNIDFDEVQKSNFKEWIGAIDLTLGKNMEKFYFNNDFGIEYDDRDASASASSNDTHFDIGLNHVVRAIKNNLQYVPQLKNGNLVQFGWSMNYGSKPQVLEILPGVFANILNDGTRYDYTHQHVDAPSWQTNLSVGYRLPMKRIGQYYSANFSVDKQDFASSIDIENEGSSIKLDDLSTRNNMDWLRSSLGVQASYEYHYRKISSQMNLPVSYQRTSYADPLIQLREKENRLLFSPSINTKYSIDAENELSFNYNRNKSFGDITNVYRGRVIHNYRMMSNNTSGINESLANNFLLAFKSGKTVKLMFYNVGLNYSKSKSSTIISNEVNENNSQAILIDQENEVNTYGINVGFDKYLFNLGSNIKIRSSINFTDYNQLFNGNLLPFLNTMYSLNPSVETRLFKKLNVSYTAGLMWLTSKEQNTSLGLSQNSFNLNQNIGFPINLMKGLHFRVSGRHLYSHQPGLKDINYIFVDSFLRYTLKKWRTDLELNLTNIGNIKRFETYNISSNIQTQNIYDLRGRMAILKAVFNLSKANK